MDKNKLKTILIKADKLQKGKELATAKEFLDIAEKIDNLSEEIKKKDFITTELKGEQGEKGIDGIDGKDGTDGVDGKDGLDGKDGQDGLNGLDGKDGENGKDGSPDTPKEIKEKLETLKKDDRLDKSAIKGLENVIDQKGLDFALGVLDQRTKFLINKATPTGSGSGDMLKATYDPANGARQVAFSNELPTGTNTGDQVGDGVTITGAGTIADPFVAVGSSSAETFETVSKNLKSIDGVSSTFNSDGLLESITYDNGITKTFTYNPTTTVITLSGSLPTGISTIKTVDLSTYLSTYS